MRHVQLVSELTKDPLRALQCVELCLLAGFVEERMAEGNRSCQIDPEFVQVSLPAVDLVAQPPRMRAGSTLRTLIELHVG